MQRVSIAPSESEPYDVVDDDKGDFVRAEEALAFESKSVAELQAVQATLAKMAEAHAALQQELATEKQAHADDVAAVSATRDEYSAVLDAIRLRISDVRPADTNALGGLVEDFVKKVGAVRSGVGTLKV